MPVLPSAPLSRAEQERQNDEELYRRRNEGMRNAYDKVWYPENFDMFGNRKIGK